MVSFEKLLDRVIKDADIVMLILDARMVRKNPRIEKKIEYRKKRFIYVINKCDLIKRKEEENINLANSVKVSAKMNHGFGKLLEAIREIAKKMNKKEVVVGIVGLPNTGKSTLINALKGRKSAGTSPISGYTKGVQKLRISKDIMMIDTPGVLPHTKETKDSHAESELVRVGAITPDKMTDPESAAIELIKELKGAVEAHYDVKRRQDHEKTLADIALKKNLLIKGGEPDLRKIAELIIRNVQKGVIKWKSGDYSD